MRDSLLDSKLIGSGGHDFRISANTAYCRGQTRPDQSAALINRAVYHCRNSTLGLLILVPREVRRDRRATLGRLRRLLRSAQQGLSRVHRGFEQQNPCHPEAGLLSAGRGIPQAEGI